MCMLRSHALVEKRAHLCSLLHSFERDDLDLIRQQGMPGAERPRLTIRMRTIQWVIVRCSMVSERCSLVLGAHSLFSLIRVLLLQAAKMRKGGALAETGSMRASACTPSTCCLPASLLLPAVKSTGMVSSL